MQVRSRGWRAACGGEVGYGTAPQRPMLAIVASLHMLKPRTPC